VSELPSATIVIVNFNGAQYLPACLDALKHQTYPSDRFEVVVTDNGSVDNSIDLLRNDYAWVKIIENRKNLGYASGNNVAIRASQSDYIVLLNNDTAPHEDWLENLVRVAVQNPRAGVVTSHIHLFYDYLEIGLLSDTFSPENEGRLLGIQVYEIDSGVPKGIYQYLDGFYGWEIDNRGRKFRWTNGHALIGLPVPKTSGEFLVKLKLKSSRRNSDKVACKIVINDDIIEQWHIAEDGLAEISFIISETLRADAVPAIQNTGSIIFKNGMSRDRGTYVKNNEALFELDHGQYPDVEQVFAGCGAGMLLRNEMLTDIGVLDDSFFMYYEDIDLCWRAHLRDWQVLYAPAAIVRHIHCGTMSEWSPLFQCLIQRNRLAMVFKNGSLPQLLQVWSGYFWTYVKILGELFKSILLTRPEWRFFSRRLWINTNVLVRLSLWKPRLAWERYHIQRKRLKSHREIETWFKE
jgi:GT2 family glycosyltransferase